MRSHHLSRWTHDHVFDYGNAMAERGTQWVRWIALGTMVVEITAGWWFNSMALLADGWHMSSHALAIGLSAGAMARRYARDPRFALGTWMIEILAGFACAIFLLGVAWLMLVGSIERIMWPQAIHYREALVVATLGLLVNLVCALIPGKAHVHGRSHDHTHAAHPASAHHHGHHDLNLRPVYLHVMADAAT